MGDNLSLPNLFTHITILICCQLLKNVYLLISNNNCNTFPFSGLLSVHKSWLRSLLGKDQPKSQKNSKQNWNVMWFKGPIN
jgi:hypothetical protein